MDKSNQIESLYTTKLNNHTTFSLMPWIHIWIIIIVDFKERPQLQLVTILSCIGLPIIAKRAVHRHVKGPALPNSRAGFKSHTLPVSCKETAGLRGY